MCFSLCTESREHAESGSFLGRARKSAGKAGKGLGLGMHDPEENWNKEG